MANFFTISGGRRSKWVTFGVWFAFIFLTAGPLNFVGKFTDAEKNESKSFLPKDAESTKALEKAEAIQGGELAQIVMVFRRDGGLQPADRAKIGAVRSDLNADIQRDRGVEEATEKRPYAGVVQPFGNPVVSPDRSTALLIAAIKSNGESETLIEPVTDIRDRYSGDEGGLQVKVTGPAGFSADAIKVFEGINGTLLLAAGGLVFFLLILIYRSPIFLFIPLLAVVFAETASRSVGYLLTEVGVTVNGQSSSLLSVFVLGAGTDYALLLVARYKEELRTHEDKHEALSLALRTAGPAIFASGLTVIAAMLCLSFAEVQGTAGLGPIAAVGILVAMTSMLTLLPALLVIVGRRAFWPFIPRYGEQGTDVTHGQWRKIGERVSMNPRRVWLGCLALLAVLSLGLLDYSDGLTQSSSFRDKVESVEGQELLAKGFPAGSSAPTEVIVADRSRVEPVAAALREAEGVADARQTAAGTDGTLISVTLDPEPYTTEAYGLIPNIREVAHEAGGPETIVGGPTAIEVDLRKSSARDTKLIVPIALVVVFLILVLLLRALLAPLLLIGTVVVSFFAALGFAAVLWDVVFGFPGSDPSLPLFAFIFLVALGIDYNIFLMARVREESLKHGTRRGMLRGLAVTGGVITSAGIVLAGTFLVLAVLPLVFLTEIGTVVAFGVLLDTFIVRSLLVPALGFDIGPKIWWPSTLSASLDRREKFDPGADRIAAEAEAEPAAAGSAPSA